MSFLALHFYPDREWNQHTSVALLMAHSSLQPTPGMPTRGPLKPPGPGDVLLGYEICQPEVRSFKKQLEWQYT